MGNFNKKKQKVCIEKGIIEDTNGKKYNIDFVGENNDFVIIDEIKKVDNESIKDLFPKKVNQINDICFINNYNYLLLGSEKGLLYVYKRKINNKSNLKFEEVCHFQPHKESIIEIIKLSSGHILTLSSDSSSKILEIEIDTNDVLYQDERICKDIQILLGENESSNNSALELESGNLIISQGYFINFFEKIQNKELATQGKNSNNTLGTKEYNLVKKIFTNSDNIFFVEIDNKAVAVSQIKQNTLDFYNLDNYSLSTSVKNIQFSNMKNSMCLINKETLAIGGNNGTIYLVNTLRKQLFFVSHFENCEHISCIRSIDEKTIIMGCQYRNNSYDVIIYKYDNKFEETKRIENVHKNFIKDIKLITMSISNNKNPLTENFNVITIGLDCKVKLLLNENN
jgi:hypothetical protein